MKTLPINENTALLTGIINAAPFPMGVYTGQELKIELANQCMLDTWGKGNNVIGKTYTEVLPELHNQEIFEQARNVLTTGIPFHAKNQRVDIVIENILTPHYFNYSFTPLFDTDGKIYGVMNTGADVTDLNTARQQVEETEERLRLAIDAAGLGTYEADLATNAILTSGNFHAIWGTNESVTKDDLVQKIHPDDLQLRDKALKDSDVTGTMFYEVRIKAGNGLWRWVRINGRISKDAKGKPVTLIGIVQDITEQKKNAEDLKKVVDEQTSALKRSNEDLLQFANVVSHDLKEPVRKIGIFNTILKSNLGDKLDQKDLIYLEKVQNSTKRMSSIIDGVLNYSTLNKSGHPVEKTNLDAIIDNIKTDLELVIQEKQAILVVDSLPEIDGATILLHQLFYNLIHNALKFSKPDNPPRVIISGSKIMIENLDHVRIVIKDNGVGFDSKNALKIFNAFERLHSKDEFEGTGLGLALCKKITERHHGTIEALGNQNDGAEFIVCLPLQQKNNIL